MDNFKANKYNNPSKWLCTAVITPQKVLMLKLDDGTLLPVVTKIQLNDDHDEMLTCTITVMVNTSEL